MLLIYLFFFSPKAEPEKDKAQTPTTAAAPAAAAAPTPAAAAIDTVQLPFKNGPVQSVQLKNPELTIDFSSQGGRVAAVRLNGYKTFFGKPLFLLDNKSARYNTKFRLRDGYAVDFAALNFETTGPQPTADGGQQLAFTAPVGAAP
ncbi:MAG: hypothetical protein WKG07_44505 [Hymenobacter sp.]